jgi:hypothetical protein
MFLFIAHNTTAGPPALVTVWPLCGCFSEFGTVWVRVGMIRVHGGTVWAQLRCQGHAAVDSNRARNLKPDCK